MTPEDYKRITEAFLRLCELPPEERQDSLQLLKQQDPNFHDAVEKMLRLDDGDERFRSSIDETVRPANSVGHVMLSAMDRGDDASNVRYQLTRLHATGGMGRVWLARDNAMGRNVALKELKPETPVAPGIWNRFLNEAKVTGQLEHPGIVPVYEVDSGDAERPFYTMRFVKGQTLHEATKEFTKRRTAGRFSELELRELITALTGVANAIGYAHSRGVLHRDLKGQNVVLGDYGEVIVLDWGLACIVGSPETDDDTLPVSGSGISDLTNAGQVIGTPAYMSPEQSRGLQDQMNAQTDVFGLGGILYEILTGQAPYNGTTAAETLALAQIGKVKPPRSLWTDAPPALEAICLKAMSRDQSHRYATAVEFADELRRWQADESVNAYPDPWTVRINRWGRRHKTLAATIAALTITAVIALTISTIMISSEQKRTLAAQERAEANLAKAREAVQTMLTEVGDTQLEDIPQMDKLRETLLQKALEFNQAFLLESNDPAVQLEAAIAYGNVAHIYALMEKSDDAILSWQQGQKILTKLQKSFPANSEYASALASNHLNQGIVRQKLQQGAQSETDIRSALTIYETLANNPQNKTANASQVIAAAIGKCYLALGKNAVDKGDVSAAETAFWDALNSFDKIDDDVAERASVLLDLGVIQKQSGRTQEALQQFEAMESLMARLLKNDADSRRYQELHCTSLDHLADCQRALGDLVASRNYAVQAVEQRQILAGNFPDVPSYQSGNVSSLGMIAILFAETGDDQNAAPYFAKAAQAGRDLAAGFPDIPAYQYEAAAAVRLNGSFLFNTRKNEEAKPVLQEAIDRFEHLAVSFPDNPQYKLDSAIAMHPLARCHQQDASVAEAIELAKRAIAIYESLLESSSDVVVVRHKLAQDYRLMGELLNKEDTADEAESYLRKALALHRKTAEEHPDVIQHRRWVAVVLDKLADFLKNSNSAAALQAIDESIEIRTQLANEQPNWFTILNERPGSLLIKGQIFEAMQDSAQAVATYQESEAMSQQLCEKFPQHSNLRVDYATAISSQARVHDSASESVAAVEALKRGTEILRKFLADLPEDPRAQDLLKANLEDLADILKRSGDNSASEAAAKEAGELQKP